MARKSVGLPAGLEFAGQSIRIRFTWQGERRCETLAYPQTPKGIKAAADLRANVISSHFWSICADLVKRSGDCHRDTQELPRVPQSLLDALLGNGAA